MEAVKIIPVTGSILALSCVMLFCFLKSNSYNKEKLKRAKKTSLIAFLAMGCVILVVNLFLSILNS